jgi:hypothetical protein
MALSRKLVYAWVRKIHMYSGLLTFTAFVVWGVTGVHVVFLRPPGQYTPPPVSSVHEIPFRAAGSLDDQKLAQAIYETVRIPLLEGATTCTGTSNRIWLSMSSRSMAAVK